VDEPALRHDCRSMLVDETERFMSQRQLPCTAPIKVRIERGSLVVSALGMSFLVVPPRPESSQLLLARVWDDLVETETVGEDADRWLSEFLGVRCKLVHLLDGSIRPVNPAYGESGTGSVSHSASPSCSSPRVPSPTSTPGWHVSCR
jgi:uncharacterized protein YcbX